MEVKSLMPRASQPPNYILDTSEGLQFDLPSKRYLLSSVMQAALSPFAIWASVFFGYYFLLSLIQLAKKLPTIFYEHSEITYSAIVGALVIGLLFGFWTYFAYSIFRSLLWQLGGHEIVRVQSNSITLTRRIFLWHWSSEYSFDDISHFREDYRSWAVAERIPGFRSNPEKDGVITFQAKGKPHRFAISVSRAEAKEIVAQIKKYVKNCETG
jgi:hypothetical protein